MCWKDGSLIGSGARSGVHGTEIGSGKDSEDRVGSGRMVNAENISALEDTCSVPEASRSHGQFVDGVRSFRALEGLRIGETCGSARNATSGAQ